MVSDPEGPPVAAAPALEEAFGLTESEAQIAVQLVAFVTPGGD